jgi:hypothetical protein
VPAALNDSACGVRTTSGEVISATALMPPAASQPSPGVIDRYFGIHPTVTKTVALKRVVWRKKRVRVRRHGRWVRIVKRVPHVVTAYEQRTVQNADYVDLVQAAQQFYASQPPPYSTGSCW